MATEVEFINGVPSFSVGQFTEVLNHVLKASFDEGVWVEGEIQGLRKPNPHAYFTLIENVDGVKAQLNINLFAGPLRNVQAKLLGGLMLNSTSLNPESDLPSHSVMFEYKATPLCRKLLPPLTRHRVATTSIL